MNKLNSRNVAIVFAFLALLLPTAVFGQTYSIQAQRSTVTEFDVNGLKVLVRNRPTAKTVSGGVFFRGGARNLTSENAGIENFALSVAAESGKEYPRNELRRELARTGSSIGAGSSNDYSVMNFASTTKDFASTWKLFVDVVLNPRFESKDVERNRALILTSLKSRNDDADNSLDALQEQVIYKNHPYANDVSGTIETITRLKDSDLRKHHKSLLQTSRMLLVVVGNISPDEVKKQVTKEFSSLRKGSYKEKPFPDFDFSKSTLDVVSRALPTNYIKGVFDAPSIGEAEYYPMQVAVTILRNRLFTEVRQKRSLSYAPSASMDEYAANTANIYVTAVDANRTMTVMLNEVKRLRNQRVTDRDIDNVVGGFLTKYFTDQQTNGAQAVSLAKFELVGGGWEKSFDFYAGVQSVTPETVQKVTTKYFKNFRFVVIGNPVAVERSIFLQPLVEVSTR